MFVYTTSTARAIEPASHISTQHRANFARAAVFAEFGTRNARALDQGDFVDRRPKQGPRHVGEVAAKVTNDTGQRTLRHQLNQAGQADTDEERKAALRTVHEIARLRGIDADLIDQEAA